MPMIISGDAHDMLIGFITCVSTMFFALLFLTGKLNSGEGGVKLVSELIDVQSPNDSIHDKTASLAMSLIIYGTLFAIHCFECLVRPSGDTPPLNPSGDTRTVWVMRLIAFIFAWLAFMTGSICLSCSYSLEKSCHNIACGFSGFFLLLYFAFILLVIGRRPPPQGPQPGANPSWAQSYSGGFWSLYLVLGTLIFILSIVFRATEEAWLGYLILWASWGVELAIAIMCYGILCDHPQRFDVTPKTVSSMESPLKRSGVMLFRTPRSNRAPGNNMYI